MSPVATWSVPSGAKAIPPPLRVKPAPARTTASAPPARQSAPARAAHAAAPARTGAPPVAGFISKWHISLGAIEAGQLPFLLVILAGSLLDVVYFFPVIKTAFFERMPEADTVSGDMEEKVVFFSGEVRNKERERPLYLFMIIPLAITAFFAIVFCLRPRTLLIYDLVQMAVNEIFAGR